MKVVGMDPGLRNFGICIAELDKDNVHLEFIEMATFTTKPCKDLTKVQDLIMRGDNMVDNLTYYVEQGEDYANVFACCVEGFSRPPSVTSAIMLGAANGIVSALIARWSPEVISVETPQHIRKSILPQANKKTPSEELVHAHLLDTYPEVADWHSRHPKYMHEHVLDAVAAVVAAAHDGRFLP
jgi:Holliday junction resolvasome RuvABC endonuclease subunit